MAWEWWRGWWYQWWLDVRMKFVGHVSRSCEQIMWVVMCRDYVIGRSCDHDITILFPIRSSPNCPCVHCFHICPFAFALGLSIIARLSLHLRANHPWPACPRMICTWPSCMWPNLSFIHSRWASFCARGNSDWWSTDLPQGTVFYK